MRPALEVLLLPFLVVVRGPLAVLQRALSKLFAFASVGAFLVFLHTHSLREFGGIWMCGAASLLLRSDFLRRL